MYGWGRGRRFRNGVGEKDVGMLCRELVVGGEVEVYAVEQASIAPSTFTCLELSSVSILLFKFNIRPLLLHTIYNFTTRSCVVDIGTGLASVSTLLPQDTEGASRHENTSNFRFFCSFFPHLHPTQTPSSVSWPKVFL